MIWNDTRLCALLNIEHPIVQAPMAGASTPEMAAAAGAAGALGSLGTALLSPNGVQAEIEAVLALSNHPVNLNFFVHEPPQMDKLREATAMQRLAPWYERLDAGKSVRPAETHFPFNTGMCDLILNQSIGVVSFHFGLPSDQLVTHLKQAGVTILSSATSAAEAVWLAERGADAIIAQGYEAGGHSGWFLSRNGEVAGTMALVPRIVDAVDVPVIAAGGIADGRGVAAALMLGAAGVQVGTAFLATPESKTSAIHKRRLLAASGDDTMISKAFSGRNARTIVNDYASEMADVDDWPDFPLMNAATAPLRLASAKAELPDAVSLWSGQGVGLIAQETTAQVVARLVAETQKALNR